MFIVVKGRRIGEIIVAVLLLAVLLTLTVATPAMEAFSAGNRRIPVYCVKTEEKVVALTFDAAWGADKTAKIIELLKEYEADATFFLVGFWIAKYPQETKLIHDSGFEIGNHSNNHLNMSKLNTEDITREISTVNDSLREITGKTPKFFRPPFGDYDNELIEGVEAQNMITIQWSVDSLDWKGIGSTEIADRVLSRVENGSIVLFHNNSDYILEALPIILVALKNCGYKMVSLDELVLTDGYTIDNNGVQHKSENAA